jgi:thiamine biosynthesis protein ThiI
LTSDKPTISQRARDIGTYDDATIPAGCNRVAPTHPETAASPGAVREAEPDDIETLVRSAIQDIRFLTEE